MPTVILPSFYFSLISFKSSLYIIRNNITINLICSSKLNTDYFFYGFIYSVLIVVVLKSLISYGEIVDL